MNIGEELSAGESHWVSGVTAMPDEPWGPFDGLRTGNPKRVIVPVALFREPLGDQFLALYRRQGGIVLESFPQKIIEPPTFTLISGFLPCDPSPDWR